MNKKSILSITITLLLCPFFLYSMDKYHFKQRTYVLNPTIPLKNLATIAQLKTIIEEIKDKNLTGNPFTTETPRRRGKYRHAKENPIEEMHTILARLAHEA